ncbi:hypothetical protein LDENG_00265940 [Lucifuga dentata]|nr:hypothetical protein LDENG_00265940 [Lucifuga dentata]
MRNKTDIQPLFISGECVERVSDFRFLGVHIEEDLTWSANTIALVKKAQQRLYFLRILRKNHLTQKLLVSFYHCSIESILSVVCQLHSSREESAPEGRHHHPEDHWLPSPLSGRSVQFPLPQKSPEHDKKSN